MRDTYQSTDLGPPALGGKEANVYLPLRQKVKGPRSNVWPFFLYNGSSVDSLTFCIGMSVFTV